MSILITIFSLLSCSGQTDKNNGATKGINQQVTEPIKDYKNRLVHKNLTEEIIDSTSDDDLLQVIFDNLTTRLPDDYSKEYKAVMRWNKAQQAIYMTWLLEGEVNNGGYNQFYANSSGQFYKHLPEALKLIGANKLANLTQQWIL